VQEVHTRGRPGVVVLGLSGRSGPAVPIPVYRTAVVLSLLLLTWCSLPRADARRHSAGPGPVLGAYPWAGQWNPLALDPWGFVQRQCTSFAAWYLNAHGVPFAMRTRGPGGEGLFLGAGQWDSGARRAGFPVETTPVVGSIAQWRAGESSPPVRVSQIPYPDVALTAGGYGHVAVVAAVLRDGSVLVAEYDGGDRGFHLLHTRAPRYLYIGTPRGAPRATGQDLLVTTSGPVGDRAAPAPDTGHG
jgi:surface antigen